MSLLASPAQATVSFVGTGNPAIYTGSAGSVNLTSMAGPGGDWVDYGPATPGVYNDQSSFNDKSTGGGQIGASGQSFPSFTYNQNPIGFTFTDGTAPVSETDYTYGTYYDSNTHSFLFSVSPVSDSGTLTVYVGGYLEGGTLTVTQGSQQISNDYTGSATGTAYDAVYAISYSNILPTPFTVQWAGDGTSNQNAATSDNITLQAAVLTPTLSPAPEPSEAAVLALMALGLGVCLLRARSPQSASVKESGRPSWNN